MSENMLNEKEVLLQEEVADDVAVDAVADDKSDNNINDDVLLKVENLCQYFKLGKSTLKAVNNVSFDIKRGEVFGLVGESGCGKTTTGRSIIKLYDCTSGNVYFEGRRICAGTKSYKDTKKAARKDFVATLKDNKTALEEKSTIIGTDATELITAPSQISSLAPFTLIYPPPLGISIFISEKLTTALSATVITPPLQSVIRPQITYSPDSRRSGVARITESKTTRDRSSIYEKSSDTLSDSAIFSVASMFER